MTDTEIIKAVAELDGLNITTGATGKFILGSLTAQLSGGCDTVEEALDYAPDYLTSRDAIVPVIEKQPHEVRSKIQNWLNCQGSDSEGRFEMNDRLMLCPATLLCKALLYAHGKLKE